MSDYHDALRQLQQKTDQKMASKSGVRAIARAIVEDRLLQWAIALLIMMALLSVVP